MQLRTAVTVQWHARHATLTRSSFAGALKGAMHRERPLLTADLGPFLSWELTEADVEDPLRVRRLPTAEEVIPIAYSLGMTLDEFLGFQHANLSPDPNGPTRDPQLEEMVAIKVMVCPETRTALRLRKATTAAETGDLLRHLPDEELIEELTLVREFSKSSRNSRVQTSTISFGCTLRRPPDPCDMFGHVIPQDLVARPCGITHDEIHVVQS